MITMILQMITIALMINKFMHTGCVSNLAIFDKWQLAKKMAVKVEKEKGRKIEENHIFKVKTKQFKL